MYVYCNIVIELTAELISLIAVITLVEGFHIDACKVKQIFVISQ